MNRKLYEAYKAKREAYPKIEARFCLAAVRRDLKFKYPWYHKAVYDAHESHKRELEQAWWTNSEPPKPTKNQ